MTAPTCANIAEGCVTETGAVQFGITSKICKRQIDIQYTNKIKNQYDSGEDLFHREQLIHTQFMCILISIFKHIHVDFVN